MLTTYHEVYPPELLDGFGNGVLDLLRMSNIRLGRNARLPGGFGKFGSSCCQAVEPAKASQTRRRRPLAPKSD